MIIKKIILILLIITFGLVAQAQKTPFYIRVQEKFRDLRPGTYKVKRVSIENRQLTYWPYIPNEQYARDGEGYPMCDLKFEFIKKKEAKMIIGMGIKIARKK